LNEAGQAFHIGGAPLRALNEITPIIESTVRKKRIMEVEETLMSHLVNSIAPLRTNGIRKAKNAVSKVIWLMIMATSNAPIENNRKSSEYSVSQSP
jgi:hypothetical protein